MLPVQKIYTTKHSRMLTGQRSPGMKKPRYTGLLYALARQPLAERDWARTGSTKAIALQPALAAGTPENTSSRMLSK